MNRPLTEGPVDIARLPNVLIGFYVLTSLVLVLAGCSATAIAVNTAASAVIWVGWFELMKWATRHGW